MIQTRPVPFTDGEYPRYPRYPRSYDILRAFKTPQTLLFKGIGRNRNSNLFARRLFHRKHAIEVKRWCMG